MLFVSRTEHFGWIETILLILDARKSTTVNRRRCVNENGIKKEKRENKTPNKNNCEKVARVNGDVKKSNKKKLILIKVFVYVAVSLLTNDLTRLYYAYQLFCWFDKKPIRRWINFCFEHCSFWSGNRCHPSSQYAAKITSNEH